MFTKIYEKLKSFIVNNYKFLLTIILIFIFCFSEIPYVIYAPGGLVPLEKRIKIANEYKYSGSFNMSYVSMLKGKLPLVMASFIFKDWDLLNKKDVSLEENIDDLIKLEKLYMTSSINNATILAYQKSGHEITITKNINHIIYITDEAKTNLKKYDQILKVENEKIKDINKIKELINKKKAGDILNLLVLRNGQEKTAKAKIYSTSNGLKIGVVFLTTYEYITNPIIEVQTKNKESGSSGGLMLSLAIYNKLTSKDITKGYKIAGTGVIDINGNVGSIDGVKYKILGASKNNADIFLCPKENEREALKVKKRYNLQIKVKGVKTFNEALNYLEELQ